MLVVDLTDAPMFLLLNCTLWFCFSCDTHYLEQAYWSLALLRVKVCPPDRARWSVNAVLALDFKCRRYTCLQFFDLLALFRFSWMISNFAFLDACKLPSIKRLQTASVDWQHPGVDGEYSVSHISRDVTTMGQLAMSWLSYTWSTLHCIIAPMKANATSWQSKGLELIPSNIHEIVFLKNIFHSSSPSTSTDKNR